MEKPKHLLAELWENYSMELADQNSELKPVSLGKHVVDMFAVGQYYYFVLNIVDYSLHQISESILTIHGLNEYPSSLQEIMDLIHPEDVDFVVKAEKMTLEKMKEIGFQHKLNLKTSYCFRMKVADGAYHLFHHQVIHLAVDDEGRFLNTLNIHTDIQHITQVNSYVVLVNGIGERNDYFQIDLSDRQAGTKTGQLTKREMEVLKLIARGLSSESIAEALFLSIHTVRVHRKNILKKTGSPNSSGLIKKSIELGLL